jgi:hypothetical protein
MRRLLPLIGLACLTVLLVGCSGGKAETFQLGERQLETHPLTGGWSFVRAHLPEDVECVKWEGHGGGDLSCLKEPVGLEDGLSVSSNQAGGGWSTTTLGGKVFCIKWEAHGEQGALSCFKQTGYSGEKAVVSSRPGSGGWSVANVLVPGEGSFTCIKWETYSGGKYKNGAGAISCRERLDSDQGPVRVTSTKLDGGWSVARVDAGRVSICVKWEGGDAGGMTCRAEEGRYEGEPVAIASLKFGESGWSTQEMALDGYPTLRCLKWSDSSAGGISCFPARSA